MSFYLILHFDSEDEQPTMAQCELVANMLCDATKDSPVFDNIKGVMLETPQPSDLDMSKVLRAN
jgi:hypothetical protein